MATEPEGALAPVPVTGEYPVVTFADMQTARGIKFGVDCSHCQYRLRAVWRLPEAHSNDCGRTGLQFDQAVG
jgi:hypothetical protein